MKHTILLILLALLCTACEYIPNTVYEIETIDGQIIKLSCPVMDDANTYTNIIENYCVVIKS